MKLIKVTHKTQNTTQITIGPLTRSVCVAVKIGVKRKD